MSVQCAYASVRVRCLCPPARREFLSSKKTPVAEQIGFPAAGLLLTFRALMGDESERFARVVGCKTDRKQEDNISRSFTPSGRTP